MHNLLKRRNNIAHGDQRRGITEEEYGGFDRAVFEICYKLIDFLEEAHAFRKFARVEAEYYL